MLVKASMIFGGIILISVLPPWFLIGVVFHSYNLCLRDGILSASTRKLKVRCLVLTFSDSFDLSCSFSDLVASFALKKLSRLT